MNRKSYRGHAAVKDAAQGIAEIVVSAYGNVDHEGDVVLKGASAKQIAGDYGPNPKGMLDHNYSMLTAVAKTLRWWEEDDGLHIEAQYNLEKQVGREAFSDLIFYGEDMEFSVTYKIKATERPTPEQKAAGTRRVISEWEIDEWSGVWLGMNSETGVVAAKAMEVRPDGTPAPAKALVGSYEHLTTRLRDALAEAFPSDYIWVRGTMADRVVFEREVDTIDGWKWGTFEVTYTDDGTTITFGDPVEVTVSEIVEPKAAPAPEAKDTEQPARVPFDRRAAQLRHLVASTPGIRPLAIPAS